MRQSQAALAVIHRTTAGETEFLVQWNEGWQALHLVGGHRRKEESFHACLVREIEEELGLRPKEYRVAEHPLAHLEYIAYSRAANQETAYVMELFDVVPPPAILERIATNPLNAWVTLGEGRVGRTTDGRPISESFLFLLTQAGLVDANG
jgi:8-oxo-dGTP pyrophosphatase MutT (NUDIX family)